MTEDEQAAAWDREVTTLQAVVRQQLASARLIKPAKVPPTDIRQTTVGVLMIASLPPDAFALAIRHLRYDFERRHPGRTLRDVPRD